MNKIALITGISGQDGSYLAEFLLSKGYEIHGAIRPSSYDNEDKKRYLVDIIDNIELHSCVIENQQDVLNLIDGIKPDECYHLAANSFDNYSYDGDFSIIATNFNSSVYFLSAIKSKSPHTRFYFSGSSQMFGNPDSFPQNENTVFNPRSMYGITKTASHMALKNYRELFGVYACTGITYNHESVRRGRQFVTRKITSGVSDIYHGRSKIIELGDINATRDWGYAPDFVRAMWMMLNNPKGPSDYVISTGYSHTIEEIVNIAFSIIDYDPSEFILINKKYLRATENIPLVGDSSKIRNDLGWTPTKNFRDIITEMTLYDLENMS